MECNPMDGKHRIKAMYSRQPVFNNLKLLILVLPINILKTCSPIDQAIPYCFNFSRKVEREISSIRAAFDLFPLTLFNVFMM